MIRLCLLLLAAQALQQQQPIPFSHKVHAGTMKLACKTCHPNPDPGETETIAAPDHCMQCHSAIKADSPPIQRLAEAAKAGRQIPWVRVYSIPSFVNFSHRKHTSKECNLPGLSRPRGRARSSSPKKPTSPWGVACNATPPAKPASTALSATTCQGNRVTTPAADKSPPA